LNNNSIHVHKIVKSELNRNDDFVNTYEKDNTNNFDNRFNMNIQSNESVSLTTSNQNIADIISRNSINQND